MTNVFVMLGGIALFMAVLLVGDWLSRRKDAKPQR